MADDTTVADLIAAEIPWADGMCDSRGDRVEVGADGEAFTYDSYGSRQEPLYPPNPSDRATFLLLVDAAERRRVQLVWVAQVGHRLDYARSLRAWDGPTLEDVDRPRLIAAVARALREARRG